MVASVRRLVCRDGADRQAIAAFAGRYGLVAHHVTEASEDEPREEVWLAPDGETALHAVEDATIGQGARWLGVRGRERDALVAGIVAELDVWTPEALADAVRTADPVRRAHLVVLVGVAASEIVDPRLLRALTTAATHPRPTVRMAVAEAAIWATWRTLEPLLETMATRDPEEGVRARAEIALDLLRERVWR